METRFPMTTGLMVKLVTAMTLVITFVLLPVQSAVMWHFTPVGPWRWFLLGVFALTFGALAFTFLLAPRAVRLSGGRLVVERWLWSDFAVPLRTLTSVEEGPQLKLITGDVRRVAGNGGLMGFTGLFHVRNVGVVRCWATQLERPTVLVRRTEGRPLLLGVDDASALMNALRRNGVSSLSP
ncbi:MAG: hypothetical protein JNM17_04670 [Archangium sp.]|nr:hypothetical protein [Archangium sp.]